MSAFLVGKQITGMQIADDKKALLFSTDAGPCVAKTDGDCCSNTWIEHVELPAGGFPALVTAVEDIPMPDLGNMPDRDVVAYYGCKITTDKGHIIVDYRNDSNGYYGGNLWWPDSVESFYGGVHGQNVSAEKWVEITT